MSLNLIGVVLCALVSSSRAFNSTIEWDIQHVRSGSRFDCWPTCTTAQYYADTQDTQGRKLNQGDNATFWFSSGSHDVKKFRNKEAFDTCDFTGASGATLYFSCVLFGWTTP